MTRLSAEEYRRMLETGEIGGKKKGKHQTRGHVRGEWVELKDGRRFFCRSKFEAHRARLLELMVQGGEIQAFEHEPKVFEFPGIRGRNYSYTPDFKVIRMDGSHYWEETKGWLDQDSKVKLKRMKKYFPEEEVILIRQR